MQNSANSPIARIQNRNYLASRGGLCVERAGVDGICAPHDHDVAEITVIISGEGWHHSMRGREQVQVGDVFILRPGVWHSYEDCRKLVVWNCMFTTEFLQRELAPMTRNPAMHYLFWAGPLGESRGGLLALHLNSTALRECEKLLRAMQKLQSEDEPAARVETTGYLLIFLAQLARNLGAEHREATSQRPVPTLVQCGTCLLENDLSHEWTLSELSSRLHVNKHHLARLFKEHTGLAPMAYLARCRAECAAGLLLQTEQSISEIAVRSGWLDPNLFARRFKAHFGLSATQYRARFGRESVTSDRGERYRL